MTHQYPSLPITVALICVAVLLVGCAESSERNGSVTETASADSTSDTVTTLPKDTIKADTPMPPRQKFRIVPLEPIETIRERALKADPPAEVGEFKPADLVELTDLDDTIALDVRYATEDNFMGAIMYTQARAFLQRPAAEALVRAHQSLKEKGLGIIVYDGYRPWTITKMFWDATPKHQRDFVANPADGSRHNRGCAVDIGLYKLATGEPVEMPSEYDEFTPRAYVDYAEGPNEAREARSLLIDVMESNGFAVYSKEWWHFDFHDWRAYPILNIPFEELD